MIVEPSLTCLTRENTKDLAACNFSRGQDLMPRLDWIFRLLHFFDSCKICVFSIFKKIIFNIYVCL
jgi:hypothetical protein